MTIIILMIMIITVCLPIYYRSVSLLACTKACQKQHREQLQGNVRIVGTSSRLGRWRGREDQVEREKYQKCTSKGI